MGMSNAAGGAKRAAPVVNVTPLVDVALVVLIIFLVVAPMVAKTFSLSIPPESKVPPPAVESDQPLVMTLDEHGVMRLNELVVDPKDLPEVLPPRIAGAKHKVLHFDADDTLPYGQVVAAVDRCRAAGAKSIAVVTKKLGSK